MANKIVVVDGLGNLRSVVQALRAAAPEADVLVSSSAADLDAADRIVLPGQGAFADCAAGVAGIAGLRGAIEARVDGGAPFLGICVGMQLMAERGLEHGETPGFGWVGGEIARMEAPGLRLPQMGWNALDLHRPDHPLLHGVETGEHVYFVHSYALRGGRPGELVATTEYGGPVPALVARGNRAGTQFHVEKSQGVGLRILANFLRWAP